MSKPTYRSLCQQLVRFEKAADAYAFIGTIPRYESDEAFAAYEAVEAEYERAKKALLKSFRQLADG